MQIETVGKYQLHLIAIELPDGRWDPFVTIFKFDDTVQDFICVLGKRRAAKAPCANYDEAIDAARRAGSAYMQSGTCLGTNHVNDDS